MLRWRPAGKIVLCLAVVGLLAEVSPAAVIQLKNSKTVEGEIGAITDNDVTVEIPGLGLMTFRIDEVASINGEPVQAQTEAGGQKGGNAAIHYSKAFDLLLFPTSKEQQDAIQAVIEGGWGQDSQEFESLLKQNEAFLSAFQSGLAPERCDFSFGMDPALKTLPHVVKTRDSTYLVLLQGRYQEHLGNIDSAIDSYLSLLTYAQHVGQTRRFVAVMLVEAIEQLAFQRLREYVTSPEASQDRCKKIVEFLSWYEDARPTVSQLREIEREAQADEKALVPWVPFDDTPFKKGEKKYRASGQDLKELRVAAQEKTR